MGKQHPRWMTTEISPTPNSRLYPPDLSLIFLIIALAGLIGSMCTACQQAVIENPAGQSASPRPEEKPATTIPPTQLIPSPTTSKSTSVNIPTISARVGSDSTAVVLPKVQISQPITTTLLFTGIIVPARCVQAKIDLLNNPNYLYEEVRETISSADLSIGVFNATMSDQIEPTGCLTTWQLVGRPENADAAAWAGFDMMGVATNHIKDCGLMKSWCDFAFFDTLENLKRVGIQTVGGGGDLEEALQPVIVEINGVRFGFISLGDSKMDPSVFARDDHPGIAELTPENIDLALKLVRGRADVVIVMPHWGSEDNPVPNWNQTQRARMLVSGGADLIVGNHPHVVQAIKQIDDVPVFYGLGNFVFDQGLRNHRQGVILLVYFQGSKYTGYKLIPTHTDADGRVHIANPEEAVEIMQNIEAANVETP